MNNINLEDKVKIYDSQSTSISLFTGDDRFIIIAESTSRHCCFEYTIVDTKEGKEAYGDYWKKTMCETFDRDEAIIICYALNECYGIKKMIKV